MQSLKEWTLNLIHQYGLAGLFSVAFVESSFFPVPPDVLIVALLLAPQPPSPFWVATICTVGSVLGAGFGWLVGAYGGYPLLRKMFKEEKVRAVEQIYNRYGMYAIFIAAFTPIPYKVFTIASGALRYNIFTMMAVSVVGRGARFFAVAYLVHFFGEAVLKQFDRLLLVGTVAFVALGAGYIYYRTRYSKVRRIARRLVQNESTGE
ncbi:MAG: DedA family protein [Fimbriimonadales bacterium]|nr:DedA family protein [Fimbriimonadales bacterium]MDW8052041.1 YqaA family protein [Armatimonadota bacterium]